jgi:hypothetical protein
MAALPLAQRGASVSIIQDKQKIALVGAIFVSK